MDKNKLNSKKRKSDDDIAIAIAINGIKETIRDDKDIPDLKPFDEKTFKFYNEDITQFLYLSHSSQTNKNTMDLKKSIDEYDFLAKDKPNSEESNDEYDEYDFLASSIENKPYNNETDFTDFLNIIARLNSIITFNVDLKREVNELTEKLSGYVKNKTIGDNHVDILKITEDLDSKNPQLTTSYEIISEIINEILRNDDMISLFIRFGPGFFDKSSYIYSQIYNNENQLKSFLIGLLDSLDDINKDTFKTNDKIKFKNDTDYSETEEQMKNLFINSNEHDLNLFNTTIITDENNNIIVLVQPTFPYGTITSVLTEISHDFNKKNFPLFSPFLNLLKTTINTYAEEFYNTRPVNPSGDASGATGATGATGRIEMEEYSDVHATDASSVVDAIVKSKVDPTVKSKINAIKHLTKTHLTEEKYVQYFFLMNRNITIIKYNDGHLMSINTDNYADFLGGNTIPRSIFNPFGQIITCSDSYNVSKSIMSSVNSDQVTSKDVSFINFDAGKSGIVVTGSSISEKSIKLSKSSSVQDIKTLLNEPTKLFIYSFNGVAYIKIIPNYGLKTFTFIDIRNVCMLQEEHTVTGYTISNVSIKNVVDMFYYFLDVMFRNDTKYHSPSSSSSSSSGYISSSEHKELEDYLSFLTLQSNTDEYKDKIHFLICLITLKLYGDLITYWLSLILYMQDKTTIDQGILSSGDYSSLNQMLVFTSFAKLIRKGMDDNDENMNYNNTHKLIFDNEGQKMYYEQIKIMSINHIQRSDIMCAVSNREKYVFKLFNILSNRGKFNEALVDSVIDSLIDISITYSTSYEYNERLLNEAIGKLSVYVSNFVRKIQEKHKNDNSLSVTHDLTQLYQDSNILFHDEKSIAQIKTRGNDTLEKQNKPIRSMNQSNNNRLEVLLRKYQSQFIYWIQLAKQYNIDIESIPQTNLEINIINSIFARLQFYLNEYNNIINKIEMDSAKAILIQINAYDLTNNSSINSDVSTFNLAEQIISDLFDKAFSGEISSKSSGSGGNKKKKNTNKRRTNKRRIHRIKTNTNKRKINTNKKTTNKRRIHIRKKNISKKIESRI
jgi:hypothetical protein